MSDLASLFAELERQHGLPSGYMARTAQIESGMDPNARNPRSSAGGLFQFIDGTARQYNLQNRFDPVEASQAAARLAADNASFLRRRLGRDPTAAELYLAHQQGAGGAINLLSNPNSRVGGAEVTLNAGRDGMTGGEFANQWISKFDGRPANAAVAMASRVPAQGGGGAQAPRVPQNARAGMQSNLADTFAGDAVSAGQAQRRGGFIPPPMRRPEPVFVAPVGHEQPPSVLPDMPYLTSPDPLRRRRA